MLNAISGAEKVGWLGLIGGTVLAAVQVVRFLATFFREHEMLMKNMEKTAALVDRFPVIEENSRAAKEERNEIIEELRGLRREINDVLKLMIQVHPTGN